MQGLRINLNTGALSFDGVGISFEIPGVLSIDGEIDHIHVDVDMTSQQNAEADLTNAGLLPSVYKLLQTNPPTPSVSIDVFAGQVDVTIIAADNLEVNAKFIVGHFGGLSVFFLDLDVELPVGIPIFLDVSLYGLQGLVASNLQPNPASSGNTWWEWYKYPTDATGIDTNATPDYDATDVSKWVNYPDPGAFALGVGATIGTSADDGFTVSAAVMLVIMTPGPVFSLIGKANILSKRIGSAQQDANFEAMATYDGNAGTFDLTIDAQYQIPVVLDIEGTAELYVDAHSGVWFFALGKPPHDKRLKARLLDIFETDAYFVIGDWGLLTGTWVGYSASWSFGPLAVSLDAYLATLAAIQWSPLQLAGGIELHGNVHLSAFGIGLGLTADALLEGCAPNPFWVRGGFQVELDLSWPLPNVGATVSLSWGGDDGSVPPPPLALSHIDATLVDHTDASDKSASDHYVLLAHRPGGPFPDSTVQYDDPTKPGVLWLNSSNDSAWHNRVDGKDPLQILPDLTPDGSASSTQLAPVVPQDAHFTLSFARSMVNQTVYTPPEPPNSPQVPGNSQTLPLPVLPNEVVSPAATSIVGPDDMSNINPNPPAVQWAYQHALKQVAIYEWDGSAWQPICSIPAPATPGPTQLNGVWLSPPPPPAKSDPSQVQTQLKVFPYVMLPGPTFLATWDASSGQQVYGTLFTDQGLQFTLDAGLSPAQISSVLGAPLPGLATTFEGASTATLHIQFQGQMQLNSITSLLFVQSGEFMNVTAPAWAGDGTPLTPASSSQDPTNQWFVQNFDDTAPAIQELSVALTEGTLLLYNLSYQSPDIPMAILPDAPALYAIKVVTSIKAGRVNGGTPDYQTLGDSDPIVEFAYFQTAAGPGTAIMGGSSSTPPPDPAVAGPYPQLALNCQNATIPPSTTSSGQTQGAAATPSGQQPAAAFPLGGALDDLHTYTQWSWPLDGAAAAYYGYDVNVEFVESYVNALYSCFSAGEPANSLHFRCVDRNQAYTFLLPIDIHVPSIPEQSALVAVPEAVPMPLTIATPAGNSGPVLSNPVRIALEERARRDELTAASRPDPAPPWLPSASTSAMAAASTLRTRSGSLAVERLGPGVAGSILQWFDESAAAAAARAIWFKPLIPSTRYTLDVVAGPALRGDDSRDASQNALQGTLEAVFTAPDAITALAALQAYYAYENSLTTLERVQFTSSRYATFADQMANVVAQIAQTAGIAPIRHYVAAVDPEAWLADPSHSDANRIKALGDYIMKGQNLAKVVATFDPVADDLQKDGTPADTGAGRWSGAPGCRGGLVDLLRRDDCLVRRADLGPRSCRPRQQRNADPGPGYGAIPVHRRRTRTGVGAPLRKHGTAALAPHLAMDRALARRHVRHGGRSATRRRLRSSPAARAAHRNARRGRYSSTGRPLERGRHARSRRDSWSADWRLPADDHVPGEYRGRGPLHHAQWRRGFGLR